MKSILKQGFMIACGAAFLTCALPQALLGGQKTSAAESAAAQLNHAMDLASRGHCVEALPVLKRYLPHLKDKKYRYSVAMLSAQCGMSTDEEDAVVESLLVLNREFPTDPRVLYITTRYYSELANRAAHRLLKSAPNSAEAEQLLAQSYQDRGKYKDAMAKYRQILKQHPNQPGIHYQIGRIILANPLTPETSAEAKKEFEAELKVDPHSPAAEFMLGDLAMRAQNTEEALKHFTRATQFDAELPQPYLGLGMALNALGKHEEAIKVLKKFVKMQPGDPAGYYQLAIAYSRLGDKEEAEHQMALQREAQKHWNPGPTSQEMMQPH